MQMPDVNILIHAFARHDEEHTRYATWLAEVAAGPTPFALSELVMQGFVRIVTNRTIFSPAATPVQAFEFLQTLLSQPHCVVTRPGPRYWNLFRELCETKNIRGPRVSDAAHAALAIESGCTWVTADTDFARFAPMLRWRHL